MVDKKKLLIVDFSIPHLLKDNEFPSGGVASEWLSWIEGFSQVKNKIGILTWKGAKKFINKEVNFDIVEAYELNKGIPILRTLYYRLPKFIKAIKNYNSNIIIQGGANNLTFLSSITSKFLNKIFIYRVASNKDVDDRIKKKFGRRAHILYKIALKNTDIFVCQNEYQHRMLKEKFPGKKNIILHPPYAIKNNPVFNNAKKRSFIAWMGGNFRYEKNVTALINIARSLPEIEFKITGKTSAATDMASYKALEELKTLRNVELVGYIKRSEILEFVSNAIALLNTSHLEGFPTTFLEAWAMGTPVISTKNVNPDYLITKHKLGMVAESFDDLPFVIKELIDSEPNKDLRIRCREYVEKHHDPETLARKLIETVTEMTNSN